MLSSGEGFEIDCFAADIRHNWYAERQLCRGEMHWRRNISKLILAIIACASIFVGIGSAAAQPHPSSSITMNVPFPESASTDMTGRTIAQRMRSLPDHPVVFKCLLSKPSSSMSCNKVAQVEVGRHCSCDPTGVLRPPGFNCEALCGSRSPPQPPPPKVVHFGAISYLARCETLEFNQGNALKDLLSRLRNDAFAEALQIYIRDLENVVEPLRDLTAKAGNVNSDCNTFNTKAISFDEDASDWNQSNCVSGVHEPLAGECASRRKALTSRREELEADYDEVSDIDKNISASFNGISANAQRAVANANEILNPDNSEQVLRLYIWYVLTPNGQAPFDSCRTLAKIARALGRRVARQDLFIDYLTRNVIEPQNYVSFLAGRQPRAPAVTVSPHRFDSSGFKSKFFNQAHQTKNLVRHTAVHLLTGYKLPVGITANNLVTYYRDILRPSVTEYGDYYLALAAGQLGYRLSHGAIRANEFGNALATQLCD